MTAHPRLPRVFCALLLAFAAALPLLADRTHAVRLGKINISGTVTDATTGAPLKGVIVASGDAASQTDDAGHYSLTVIKSSVVTASRPGYVPVLKDARTASLDFALPQTPNITVKTTTGQTFIFDAPSVKFGYSAAFQYTSAESPTLCRIVAGAPEQWLPAKADMKRITGPARPLTSAPCCDRGPVMAVDVELKSGETTTGYLTDNCFGYKVEVSGLDRATGTAKFIPLTDVAEIIFP